MKKKHKDKRRQFSKQIDKLREYPDKYGKLLGGRLHDYWQIRFADKFRIWYTIDEEEQTVTIEAIKHKDEAKKYY